MESVQHRVTASGAILVDNSGVAASLPLHVEKRAGTDWHNIAEAYDKNRLSTKT